MFVFSGYFSNEFEYNFAQWPPDEKKRIVLFYYTSIDTSTYTFTCNRRKVGNFVIINDRGEIFYSG